MWNGRLNQDPEFRKPEHRSRVPQDYNVAVLTAGKCGQEYLHNRLQSIMEILIVIVGLDIRSLEKMFADIIGNRRNLRGA